MDEDNLRARVGDVQFAGVGYLDDHRLVFNRLGTRRPGGVSSVEPRKGARVYGAVWRLDETQLATLDEIENPAAYQRQMADITLTESGKRMSCNIYVAFPVGVYPADQPYLELLIGAAQRLGFPASYIRRLKTFRTGAGKRG
jgi:gamma-glutamylcyclotransferase (GGCT)/AIG2-like uncharacterized protein YtfP